MNIIIWIIIAVVVIIILWLTITYNRLIVYRNRIENSWAQIDVQLKRRFDLIPNLVKTVKAYVKHERETFESITQARTLMTKATSVKEKAKAENMLTGALKTIFAVAEAYPNLRANENFKMLQEELSGTESKIAYARQFYNDGVMVLNQYVQSFPSNVLARMFGFKEHEYFEIESEAKKRLEVDL